MYDQWIPVVRPLLKAGTAILRINTLETRKQKSDIEFASPIAARVHQLATINPADVKSPNVGIKIEPKKIRNVDPLQRLFDSSKLPTRKHYSSYAVPHPQLTGRPKLNRMRNKWKRARKFTSPSRKSDGSVASITFDRNIFLLLSDLKKAKHSATANPNRFYTDEECSLVLWLQLPLADGSLATQPANEPNAVRQSLVSTELDFVKQISQHEQNFETDRWKIGEQTNGPE